MMGFDIPRLYEIRLLGQGRDAVSIFSTLQPSDGAAVARARRLASDIECGIEVWRGMECVYAGQAA